MFGKTKEQLQDEIVELRRNAIKVEDLEASHKREVEDLEHKHKLDIAQKEFDLKNHKDKELLEKDEANAKLKNENDVIKKEVEMMKQMVDINADIVDVKDIINKLIEKLPQMNLTSLTVNAKSEK